MALGTESPVSVFEAFGGWLKKFQRCSEDRCRPDTKPDRHFFLLSVRTALPESLSPYFDLLTNSRNETCSCLPRGTAAHPPMSLSAYWPELFEHRKRALRCIGISWQFWKVSPGARG